MMPTSAPIPQAIPATTADPPVCDGCDTAHADLTISLPQGRRCDHCGVTFVPGYALRLARFMGDSAVGPYLRSVFGGAA